MYEGHELRRVWIRPIARTLAVVAIAAKVG